MNTSTKKSQSRHSRSSDYIFIEQVQRRAVRFVTRTYSREEGCVTRALNHLSWLPLQHRRQTARLCMLYKSLNQQADVTIPTYVQHQNLLCTRRTHPLKFIPLQTSCDGYKFSFWPRTINDWNNLHAEIITSDSMSQLKLKSALNMQSEHDVVVFYYYSSSIVYLIYFNITCELSQQGFCKLEM